MFNKNMLQISILNAANLENLSHNCEMHFLLWKFLYNFFLQRKCLVMFWCMICIPLIKRCLKIEKCVLYAPKDDSVNNHVLHI